MNRSRSLHEGLAVLSYGFRPLFLFAGIFAVLSIGFWLPEFKGEISIPTAFAPVVWHAHEMLYGYLVATVSGFLLTAIPNWTGRLPFNGRPLALLAGLWLAGRIAIAASAHLGWALTMLVDCSFLLTFVAVTSREVLAGRNFKNLKVVILVSVLLIGNVTFHIEAHWTGNADHGTRTGIAGMVMLVMVIGGRIIPSFTRNWLARQADGRMPVGFNRFDVVAIGISALALLSWVTWPDARTTSILLAAAGFVQLARLARWAGERTWRDRLVLVLHIAYLFVPAGFLLLAASDEIGIAPSAGIHAWTIGAMATLTLAVMTRATLGHTGRLLRASPATQFIFGSIVVAALLRIGATLYIAQGNMLLHLSAGAWMLAFVVFAVIYGPMLLQRKVA
ncbi:NnrS family protein [Bradyrhizobium sp. JR3.5]